MMDKVNQRMKKFTLRGVLDGLRSSVIAPPNVDIDIEENLRSEHFQMSKVSLSLTSPSASADCSDSDSDSDCRCRRSSRLSYVAYGQTCYLTRLKYNAISTYIVFNIGHNLCYVKSN